MTFIVEGNQNPIRILKLAQRSIYKSIIMNRFGSKESENKNLKYSIIEEIENTIVDEKKLYEESLKIEPRRAEYSQILKREQKKECILN